MKLYYFILKHVDTAVMERKFIMITICMDDNNYYLLFRMVTAMC